MSWNFQSCGHPELIRLSPGFTSASWAPTTLCGNSSSSYQLSFLWARLFSTSCMPFQDALYVPLSRNIPILLRMLGPIQDCCIAQDIWQLQMQTEPSPESLLPCSGPYNPCSRGKEHSPEPVASCSSHCNLQGGRVAVLQQWHQSFIFYFLCGKSAPQRQVWQGKEVQESRHG